MKNTIHIKIIKTCLITIRDDDIDKKINTLKLYGTGLINF